MMKIRLTGIVVALCCFTVFFLTSLSLRADGSLQSAKVDLVSSHRYIPDEINVVEAGQNIVVSGMVKRKFHTNTHIRSTVNVEILNENHVVLASKSIDVNNEMEKAANQRELPFVVALPKQDASHYQVKVSVE